MLRIFIVMSIFLVTGCGNNLIKYSPMTMSLSDARFTAEELIMTQHANWKPDVLEINDKYIAWNFGYISKGRNSAVAIGGMPFIVGKSSSTSRIVGNRIYYRSVKEVQLLSWQRKFRQWYVVSVLSKNNTRNHILRTRDLDDAKHLINAMSTLLAFHKTTK